MEIAPEAGPQVTVASVLDGERAFLTRRAGGCEPLTLDKALRWSQACHLHIAEYATLYEMPDLVTRAKQAGLSVSLDPSWDDALIQSPDLLAACKGVDVFLPNLDEARTITGQTDPEVMLDALRNHFPVIALKAGGRVPMLTLVKAVSISAPRPCGSSTPQEPVTPSTRASFINGCSVQTSMHALPLAWLLEPRRSRRLVEHCDAPPLVHASAAQRWRERLA